MSRTFGQLRDALIESSRAGAIDTRNKSIVETLLKREYKDLWYDRAWKFTRGVTNIQLIKPKKTGTVAITANGGTTLTLTNSTFASTDVGAWVWVGNHQDPLEITAYTSPTVVTVAPYLGTTTQTAAIYKLYHWKYQLPSDFFSPVLSSESSRLKTLDWFSEVHFRSLHPYPYHESYPTEACVVWEDETPYIYLHPISQDARLIPVIYHKSHTNITGDNSVFNLPEIAEEYLFEKCMSTIYLELKHDATLYQAWEEKVRVRYQRLLNIYTDFTEKLIFSWPGQSRHDRDMGYYRTDPLGRAWWGT